MPRYNTILGTITIANGATQGSILEPDRRTYMGHLVDFLIYGATALTGTCTVQVACTTGAVAGDLRSLQINGSDVTVAASKASVIPLGACTAISIVSGSAEGAQRLFPVMAQIDQP